MRAKKRLGQNFLISKEITKKIMLEVEALEDDLIIEIGPGMGALTKAMKKKNAHLIAYELDTDLKLVLSPLEDEKTKVIYKDFLQSDVRSDIKNMKYNNIYIVGNLPYYITTPIIEHIISLNLDLKRLTIMVQREVAERFLAKPGSKSYGYITLFLRYYFSAYKVCDVSSKCFSPEPKVQSAVVSFEPRKQKLELDDGYFKFLKVIFKQKRKNIRNNLKGIYEEDALKEKLEKMNLDMQVRAEELSEEQIMMLYKELTKKRG